MQGYIMKAAAVAQTQLVVETEDFLHQIGKSKTYRKVPQM